MNSVLDAQYQGATMVELPSPAHLIILRHYRGIPVLPPLQPAG